MMGCAHSQNSRNYVRRTSDVSTVPQKRLFKAINIDDLGNEISLCEIEITKTEIVLYKNGNTIKWPLMLIRRYGHDENLFSFECGRRCRTGEG